MFKFKIYLSIWNITVIGNFFKVLNLLFDDIFLCEFWYEVGRSSEHWVNCCNQSPPIPIYLLIWIRVLTSMKVKNRSKIFAEFYLILVISTVRGHFWQMSDQTLLEAFPSLLLSVECYCSFKLNQHSVFALLHVCSVMSDSCSPMDCSPPGSSVHGIFHARILEWVAISCSKISFMAEPAVSCSYISFLAQWYLIFFLLLSLLHG